MKKSLNHSILLALAFVLLQCFSAAATSQAEPEITTIRAAVAAINKGETRYTKKTKNVQDLALEGAEATFFSKTGNLKKITARLFGETYRATAELYYDDSRLIFAYLKQSRYDTQIGLAIPPKVVSTVEQRFYFADNELIRLIVGKKEVESDDESYEQLKNEIFSISAKLKDAYSSGNK